MLAVLAALGGRLRGRGAHRIRQASALPSRSLAITPSSAPDMTVLVIVSLTIVSPDSSVTPLASSVASMRAKRAVSTLATTSPSSGAASIRRSRASRTAGLRPRRRNASAARTTTASTAHHHARMNLPSVTTTSVGIGSARPACANVISNCGTTHTSSSATETTATPISSTG